MKTIKQFYLPARQAIITIIVCVAVVAGVSLVYSWTGPTQTPPDGNVPAPINISITAQTISGSKTLNIGSDGTGSLGINGALTVNGLGIFNSNVGIGTTGPGAKLQVSGAVTQADGSLASAILGSAYNHYTYFGSNTGGRIRGSSEGYLVVDSYPSGTNNKLFLNLNSSGNVSIAQGGGNVGIGTVSPGTNKLQVNGKIQAIGGDICTDQGGGKCLSTAGGGGAGGGWTDDGTTVRLTTSTDNVGIGTTNPLAKLDVNASGEAFRLSNISAANNDGIYFYSATPTRVASITRQNYGANADLAIGAYGGIGLKANQALPTGYDFYINTSGNVGIGTVSPTAKLTIEGTTGTTGIKINDTQAAGNVGIQIYTGGVVRGALFAAGTSGVVLKTNAGGGPLRLQTSDTDRLWITETGNVGIGTANPAQKLDVQGGNIRTSGQIFTQNLGALPNSWGGIHTYDVHARNSIRTHYLCLGGGFNEDGVGDCRSAWPGGGGAVVYSCPTEWWYGYGHTCLTTCVGQLSLNSTCQFQTGDGCNGTTVRNCTPAGHLAP